MEKLAVMYNIYKKINILNNETQNNIRLFSNKNDNIRNNYNDWNKIIKLNVIIIKKFVSSRGLLQLL